MIDRINLFKARRVLQDYYLEFQEYLNSKNKFKKKAEVKESDQNIMINQPGQNSPTLLEFS